MILTEIESGTSITQLCKQLKKYYNYLDESYEHEVLPIALLLRVGLDGIGWHTITNRFVDREIYTLSLAKVGLPALDATTYVRQQHLRSRTRRADGCEEAASRLAKGKSLATHRRVAEK